MWYYLFRGICIFLFGGFALFLCFFFLFLFLSICVVKLFAIIFEFSLLPLLSWDKLFSSIRSLSSKTRLSKCSSFSSFLSTEFSTLENSGESGGYPYESYAGNNLCLVMTSDTSGYIYIKFTKAATASWTYSTDPSEAPDVGKWYALSFKDLTSSSVKLSAATKAGGQTSTTTFDAAKNEFTIENGYFNIYSSCSKQ